MNYSAIILAGGKSSRMKYNKEYIKVNDTFLVHNQITLLSSIFDEIIVVSPNIDHYSNFNVKVVQDILTGSTPLIGLHSGLLASTNPYCYVIACDMPYINLDYIKYLIKTHKLKEALVTMNNGFIEPFNAIYSTNITSNIENFISTKKYGFQTFISTLDKDILSEKESSNFNPKIMFKNINTESDLIENFNEFAPITQSFNITKVQQNEIYSIDDNVITEFPLKLFINGTLYSLIMMSPTDIEVMIIGYLHSHLLISKMSDITHLNIDLKAKRCDVKIDSLKKDISDKRIDIISSACTRTIPDIKDDDLPIVANNHVFDLKSIQKNVGMFNKESILFKETGGVHSVSFIYDNKDILFEDIGRHNAVDKVCGYILKNKITTLDKYIITSGRISSDILLKAAFIGIPLIVSRSAPTALTIKLAKKLNICVIGFARGNKVNIYSNIEKIKMTF